MRAVTAPARERLALERAAEHALAYPYTRWGFGEGPALLGLLAAAEVLERPELVDAVARIVAPTLGEPPGPTDHLIPVEALAALARQRPDLDVEPAIRCFAAAVMDAPRPVAGRPPVHRPDHPRLGTLVWVDCMHTDGPGLALAGHPEAAAALLEEASAVLQDASGLYSHGYDVASGRANGVHWARGQGWALNGLVGLAVLAPGATDRGARGRIEALLAALAGREVAGRWRTIVDDPDSPLENSLSPMLAAGVITGIAHGIVDPRWGAMAERALAATVAALDDGALPVSSATPVGTPDVYRSRPTGVFPWGQGPVLLALSTAMREGRA